MLDRKKSLLSVILGNEETASRVCDFLSSSATIPTRQDLCKIRGVTEKRADKILACMELSATYFVGTDATEYRSPEDFARRLCMLRYIRQERFYVITLDSSMHELGCHEVSIGLVNKTMVHPREVFVEALNDNAVGIVIAHNHPSGSTRPSEEDVNITRILCAAGKLMQIPVIDHIIVSRAGFTSMCREMPELFESNILQTTKGAAE